MKLSKEDKKRLGVRIKELRLEKGMTTKEFGSLLGATDSNITSWEKGRTSPNPERLKMISKIAEVSVNNLLYGSINERINLALKKLSDKKIDIDNLTVEEAYNYIKQELPFTEVTENELKIILKSLLNFNFMQDNNLLYESHILESLIDTIDNYINIAILELNKRLELKTNSKTEIETINHSLSSLKGILEIIEPYQKSVFKRCEEDFYL